METLKIEKGIPLPTDTRGDTKYPVFSNMEVGDSVFFPLTEEDNPKRMKNRLAQATRLENEISGVRVWRKD